MATLEKTLEKNSDELIFSEIKLRLSQQYESIKAIDTKASFVLTFISAILAGLVNSNWFIELTWVYHLIILVSLSIATLFSLIAVLVRSYRYDPDPSGLITKYANRSENITRGQLIKNMQESFDRNASVLNDKVRYLKLGLGFLAVSIFILIISIFLSLHQVKIS